MSSPRCLTLDSPVHGVEKPNPCISSWTKCLIAMKESHRLLNQLLNKEQLGEADPELEKNLSSLLKNFQKACHEAHRFLKKDNEKLKDCEESRISRWERSLMTTIDFIKVKKQIVRRYCQIQKNLQIRQRHRYAPQLSKVNSIPFSADKIL